MNIEIIREKFQALYTSISLDTTVSTDEEKEFQTMFLGAITDALQDTTDEKVAKVIELSNIYIQGQHSRAAAASVMSFELAKAADVASNMINAYGDEPQDTAVAVDQQVVAQVSDPVAPQPMPITDVNAEQPQPSMANLAAQTTTTTDQQTDAEIEQLRVQLAQIKNAAA